MENLGKYTLVELSDLLQKRKLSSLELTEFCLSRIAQKEPQIGAFITVTADRARSQATQVDERRCKGEVLSPLAGIPFALKDNICTKGIRTTCASHMLESFVPPYQATVAERLENAGAVLLGKCNMDEFAMGSSTEYSAFHVTRNPYNPDYIPGGSSGGSAAAVAAGEVYFSLGTDTGGSIRHPAALCGVVGMRPTYGSVSRNGMISFSSSLDQIGPLTRSVADNAMVLQAILGQDPFDMTTVARKGLSFTTLDNLKGIRIGISPELLAMAKNGERIGRAADLLCAYGAELQKISLPSIEISLPAYHIISSAEASSNLARFDGIRYGHRANKIDTDQLYAASRSEGFGDEVKRRILLGTYVLSAGHYEAYYKKAMRTRTLMLREYEEAFSLCDIILSPVTARSGYRFGDMTKHPTDMYRSDLFTIPAALAGLPAMSMPIGYDGNHLPIGIQLTGRRFDENRIYQTAAFLEKILKGETA